MVAQQVNQRVNRLGNLGVASQEATLHYPIYSRTREQWKWSLISPNAEETLKKLWRSIDLSKNSHRYRARREESDREKRLDTKDPETQRSPGQRGLFRNRESVPRELCPSCHGRSRYRRDQFLLPVDHLDPLDPVVQSRRVSAVILVVLN